MQIDLLDHRKSFKLLDSYTLHLFSCQKVTVALPLMIYSCPPTKCFTQQNRPSESGRTPRHTGERKEER